MLMWMDLIKSVEGLNGIKRLTLLWVRKSSSCLWTGTLAFYCFWTQNETLPLPESQACRPLDWNYTIGSPGSQAFRIGLELQSPELPACPPLYHRSIYLSIWKNTRMCALTTPIQHYIPIGSVSLEKPSTYCVRSNFILLHVHIQLSQPHLLKRFFFPHWMS